ncbi:hypothetical protein HN51_050837 [Arachis hypogaea]|uniref:Uncharacterized protein n=2 Tax=Arachis hypogaea TaxID=3818 RepID=A0A444Y9P0_ARAHY|nr:uncharacterized protein DS421_17g585520 [Arachis hypogaea]RYQ98576.1 hypothetical protein Ahy_B07g086324 isoform A [Arachis hypogaea]
MASSVGFGFAETYVMRKVYNEKMKTKNRAQEEREEKNTNMKIDTTTIGCFSSWVSKQQHKKNSRISDSSQNESATNI